MAILILAPVLEVFENWITLILRIGLEMPVDGYVSPVPNFLRQISSIKDKFGLEKSVFPGLSEESQIQSQIKV